MSDSSPSTIQENNKRKFNKSLISKAVNSAFFASITASMLAATAANAQEAQSQDAAEDEEREVITVTATKREESIQEVALAVTALDGDFIEDKRLSDVKDIIAYTPGLTGNSQDSFLDSVSIRGVRTDDYGVGGDISVGIFKNDLYEGRSGVAVSSFFDMNRSEAVRGPQGFLFGRNAIGGAISSYTQRPELDSTEKFINVDIGEYNRLRVDGAMNIPINDEFAMRFAGMYHTEESFVENLNERHPIPDHDIKALRWSTTYDTDDYNFFTMVEYESRDRPATIYRTVTEGELYENFTSIWGEPPTLSEDPFVVDLDSIYGNKDFIDILNIQLRYEREFDDFADLIVSAGYKEHRYEAASDYDGNRFEHANFLSYQEGDYSQIEARLVSNTDSDLSWYAGASYYTEDLTYDVRGAMSQRFMCNYAANYYFGVNATSCTELDDLINANNYYLNNYYISYNYYYGTNIPTDRPTNLAFTDRYVTESSLQKGKNSGWAVYLDLDYQFTETINAQIGIRHTQDDKDISAEYFNDTELGLENFWAYWYFGYTTAEPILKDDSWDETILKALVRWRPDDDTMLYVSYTEGYKSGGFTLGSLGGLPFGTADVTNETGFINSFGPETVDSYEFGYKDSWGDNTDISLTYYYYEYTGLQIVSGDDQGGGSAIRNLGGVDGQGIEFAMNTSFGEHWDLYLTYSWLDTEANGISNLCFLSGDDFGIDVGVIGGPTANPPNNNCEGRRVFWAPEDSGAFVLYGTFPLDEGSIYTSVDGWYEGKRFASFDFLPETELGGEALFGASLGYESEFGDWWVEAYVENLTDRVIYDGASEPSSSAFYMPYMGAFWWPYKPRNFGVRFGYYWD